MRHFLDPGHPLDAAMLQGPELGGQRAGCRLQKGWQVDVVGTEADTDLAKRGSPLLVEVLHLVSDPGPLEDAQ